MNWDTALFVPKQNILQNRDCKVRHVSLRAVIWKVWRISSGHLIWSLKTIIYSVFVVLLHVLPCCWRILVKLYSFTPSAPPCSNMSAVMSWSGAPSHSLLNKPPAAVDHVWLCGPRGDGCDAVLWFALSVVSHRVFMAELSLLSESQGVWYSLLILFNFHDEKHVFLHFFFSTGSLWKHT